LIQCQVNIYMKIVENEVGYQNLDTRLTGTSSAALSAAGISDFPIIVEDIGVAKTTAQGEFRGAN